MQFFERRGDWARKSNFDLNLDVDVDIAVYLFRFILIYECPERNGTERNLTFSFAVRFVFAFVLSFLQEFEVVWCFEGQRVGLAIAHMNTRRSLRRLKRVILRGYRLQGW